jgi:cell division protein FtsX
MSLSTSTKRIIRYGLVGFFRNGFISLAAILIMTITLFVIGALMTFGSALTETLSQLTKKVDVNVYFVVEAPESDILGLKASLERLPEVAEVTYVSRDEALTRFKERHKNDQGFYDPTWWVYLGRDDSLWKTRREIIDLLDQNGKIIDSTTY